MAPEKSACYLVVWAESVHLTTGSHHKNKTFQTKQRKEVSELKVETREVRGITNIKKDKES